jgi:hypothetical protein
MAEDQEHLQDHWRELAELLGVQPDSPERPRAAPTSEHVAAEAPRKQAEPIAAIEHQPAASGFDSESPPTEPVETAQTEPAPERETVPPPQEERREWPPPADEEDRSRRGRGRRGRRGRSERQPEYAPSGPRRESPRESAEEPDLSDEEADFRSSPPATEEIREEEFADELETAPPTPTEDDEIDEEDNLSDWNVPSWNELIASLYRPER